MLQLLAHLQLLGGIALFLLGMHHLSKGMEKLAGASMQRLVERVTKGKARAFSAGLFGSALLQSSGLMMITTISMLNSGLLGLYQGVSIILGFEIGTTLTPQLVSFDIGKLAMIIIAIGFFLNKLTRNFRRRNLGQIILGLGFLFLGMSHIREAMIPLSENAVVLGSLVLFGGFPVLGALAGAATAALFQSSAVVVGVLIAMGSQGIVTLPTAIAIALGANVGTCITGFLASIGGSRAARQAVAAQVLIASFGALVFLPFIAPFSHLVALTSSSLPRQIANAHTLHNLIVSLALLPLSGIVAAAVKRIVPGKDEPLMRPDAIDPEKDPALYLTHIRSEVVRMGELAQRMLEQAYGVLLDPAAKSVTKVLTEVNEIEDRVDRMRYEIERRLTALRGPRVTGSVSEERVVLLHNAVDIERVADLSLNLVEFARDLSHARHGLDYRERETLEIMFEEVRSAYSLALQGIAKKSQPLLREVRAIEQEIDRIDRAAHRAHLRRLDSGKAVGMGGGVFLDAMRELERIGDHADNIAKSMLSYDDSDIKLAE